MLKKRVLVFEADEGRRKNIEAVARVLGLEARAASTIDQAIQLISSEKMPVVMIDLDSGGHTSAELLLAINSAHLSYRPRICGYSGRDIDRPEDYYALGIQTLVRWPLNALTLREFIGHLFVEEGEMWRTPPREAPALELRRHFKSWDSAIASKQIKFGYCGVALEADPKHIAEVGDLVALTLTVEDARPYDFTQLMGIAAVRWRVANRLGLEWVFIKDTSYKSIMSVRKLLSDPAAIPK